MQSVKVESDENKVRQKASSSLYQTVWRWHFYAGIIFAPFLFILYKLN
ncbi:hypothetical protein [Ectobacillus funiculus]|uniref:Uncharacterized protein n=1 Tax=Ectobacillus funiculus TaxID=137993 RepID=A0ABV5WJB3_9BACI